MKPELFIVNVEPTVQTSLVKRLDKEWHWASYLRSNEPFLMHTRLRPKGGVLPFGLIIYDFGDSHSVTLPPDWLLDDFCRVEVKDNDVKVYESKPPLLILSPKNMKDTYKSFFQRHVYRNNSGLVKSISRNQEDWNFDDEPKKAIASLWNMWLEKWGLHSKPAAAAVEDARISVIKNLESIKSDQSENIPIETPVRIEGIPNPGVNNIWYHNENKDTVFVFVHGFLSDSSSCWLCKDNQGDPIEYWPRLVKEDNRFGNPSIFLAGYNTAHNSKDYDISHCASQVYYALTNKDPEKHDIVQDRKNIIFVCHSAGGIVVRYLLTMQDYAAAFADRRIGLVLIASPTLGSKYANWFSPILRFANNKFGLHLRWENDLLIDLDKRFMALVQMKRRTNWLAGVEAYESHCVLNHWLLCDIPRIVSPKSAGRYFGNPRLLPQTDHFTIVKPNNLRHPAHDLIFNFYSEHFAPVRDAEDKS